MTATVRKIETQAIQIDILNDLPGQAQIMGFGDLHFKFDPATGLIAIIAIHSTKLGPAIGGCRFLEYASFGDAITDAMRLARGMSYKAAISHLHCGGGKAVLMRPKLIADRTAYFSAFGKFVHELGGRYITALDSGAELEDLDIIAKETPYVTGLAHQNGHDGNPSPGTAHGVRRGIEAAVKFLFKRDNLQGLHVAIQGVGHVGYHLAEELHSLGVKLTVCDANPAAALRCKNEFGAQIVEPDKIYQVDCDVFSPCALGGILNDITIPQLKARIIAGSANNQLKTPQHGEMLHKLGFLYAPDYAINAGGLIIAAMLYEHGDIHKAKNHIQHIYDVLLKIFARSKDEDCSTSLIADRMAEERMGGYK